MLLHSPESVPGQLERWIEEVGCQARGIEETGCHACDQLSPGERIVGELNS
jgi:hypothetical protein